MLFVSHNMAAVEGLCSRVIVLKSGELSYDGSYRDSIAYYLESMKENRGVLLKNRKDREGNGKVRAIDLRIFDKEEKETSYVGMGEDFSVEVRTIGNLKKSIIGILFGNMYRKQIIRGYTWEQISEDIELIGSDVIKCHFKNFPMMHGSYDVHIWIGQQGECADYVENAATLTILPRDVFGTAKITDPLGGVAYCRAHWKINGARII